MPAFMGADARLSTERLVLRPLSVEDADEMVEVLADPDLYTVTGGVPPTLQDLRERYRRMSVGHSPDGTQQWLNWIVRVRGDDGSPGRAIGTVQATVTAGGTHAELAWIIGTPWQGQGFASEAARAMVDRLDACGVNYVTAHIHPEHRASRAVAQRAGLIPTDEYHDGEQRWIRSAPPGSPG